MTDHTRMTPSTLATDLNVTPMLDVLLVLLVTFVAVIIPMYRTTDVVLPVPCDGSCGAGTTIVLEVRPGPEYRVNGTLIDGASLPTRLRAIYDGRPEKVIQIAGYPGVSYQAVIGVMDVARSSGVRVVSLAPKAEYPAR